MESKMGNIGTNPKTIEVEDPLEEPGINEPMPVPAVPNPEPTQAPATNPALVPADS